MKELFNIITAAVTFAAVIFPPACQGQFTLTRQQDCQQFCLDTGSWVF